VTTFKTAAHVLKPAAASREYKRFFGEPPMRDVERLRDHDEGAPSRLR